MKNDIDSQSQFLPILLIFGSAMRKLPISHYLFYCTVVFTGVFSMIKRYSTAHDHMLTLNDLVRGLFFGTLFAFAYWSITKLINALGLFTVYTRNELWQYRCRKVCSEQRRNKNNKNHYRHTAKNAD